MTPLPTTRAHEAACRGVDLKPHLWHNGACLVCAMREHWAGAADVCKGSWLDKARALRIVARLEGT